MKKISVLCPNGRNPITKITELLANANINITDIDFQRFEHDALLNVVTDDINKTLGLLASNAYTALSDETVLIQSEDKPGTLAEISRGISDRGVTIRSLTLMTVGDNHEVVAVSTNDNDTVRALYADKLLN